MPREELVEPRIRGKLARLRLTLRGRLVGEALAWLVVAAAAALFATLALDWALRLDRPVRAVVAAAAGAGLLWVAWRKLLRPFAVRMDAEGLALLVERRWGQLGDRLISALQFRPAELEAVGVSASLARRAAREANELAALLPFGQVVRSDGLLRGLGAAAAAAALVVGFGLWQPDLLDLWFQRNVLFRQVPWPQSTYLQVANADADGNFRVLRGEDLAVVVLADRARGSDEPPYILLHARYPAVGWTEERVELAAAGTYRYVKAFQAVSEEFEFYVTGGDDRRDRERPHAVRLIDPPGLKDVEFTVHYPPYMERRPSPHDGSAAVLPVPLAGRVAFRARATKDLRSVAVTIDGEPVARGEAKLDAPGGREFRGWFDVPAGEAGRARGLLPAPQALKFDLVDTDGHTNRRGGVFLLQVQPDQRPAVELGRRAVGLTVTAQARLPLILKYRDDCGVQALRVALSAKAPEPFATTRPVAPEAPGQREGTVEHELDLKDLPLAKAESVQVYAEVLDAMPAELGGPNVGRSGALEFRIVPDEELRAELVRRQKQIRLEFEQAIAAQEATRAKVQAAREILAGGEITPEVRRLLSDEAPKGQHSVAAETSNAAAKLQAVDDEMVYNRIGEQRDWQQLQALVDSLRALDKPLRQAEALLEATAAIEGAAPLAERAAQLADIQQGLRQQMEQILAGMIKFESRQELAGLLELLIKQQAKLAEEVDRLHERTIGEIIKPK